MTRATGRPEGGPLPDPQTRHRSVSCRPGTRCCSCMPGGRRCCRRSTGRTCSRPRTRRRTDVFVDGPVAGTWRHEDGEIRVSPFGKLTPERPCGSRGRGASTGRVPRLSPRRSDEPMNQSDVQGWLNRYVEAWRSNDRAVIESLFTEDAVYSYRPWDSDEQTVRGRERDRRQLARGARRARRLGRALRAVRRRG